MRLLLVVAVLGLLACAATTSDLRALPSSATRDDVLRELGEPYRTSSSGDTETWVYLLHVDGCDHCREAHELTFVSGRLWTVRHVPEIETRMAAAEREADRELQQGTDSASRRALEGLTHTGPASQADPGIADCQRQCRAQGAGCEAGCAATAHECYGRCSDMRQACERGCR